MSKLIINTDGGSRGNPGKAAIGVVIQNQSGKLIHQFAKTIGIATNNVAEYQAAISALEYLVQANLKPDSINFFLDSALVVNQLNGHWKIKDSNLKQLASKAKKLEKTIGVKITYTSIPREKNKKPDALLNQALDQE